MAVTPGKLDLEDISLTKELEVVQLWTPTSASTTTTAPKDANDPDLGSRRKTFGKSALERSKTCRPYEQPKNEPGFDGSNSSDSASDSELNKQQAKHVSNTNVRESVKMLVMKSNVNRVLQFA